MAEEYGRSSVNKWELTGTKQIQFSEQFEPNEDKRVAPLQNVVRPWPDRPDRPRHPCILGIRM